MPDSPFKVIEWSYLSQYDPISLTSDDISKAVDDITRRILSRIHRGDHIDHQHPQTHLRVWQERKEQMAVILAALNLSSIFSGA